MSVEVVQYEMNRDRCRVYRLQQVLDERHKVHLGAAGGDLDAAALALGFDGHKDVARPGPFVFVVFVGTSARLHRDWRTGLPEYLLALLIDADHRFLRI